MRQPRDPMAEHWTSAAPAIPATRIPEPVDYQRHQSVLYRRHCQRRRNIGETDRQTPRRIWKPPWTISKNPEIRDVLITGGDALLLDDNTLDWLLAELDNIAQGK